MDSDIRQEFFKLHETLVQHTELITQLLLAIANTTALAEETRAIADETRQGVEGIRNEQERQGRITESLAAHLLEAESHIRELKRAK
jgi:hypothetical protein